MNSFLLAAIVLLLANTLCHAREIALTLDQAFAAAENLDK